MRVSQPAVLVSVATYGDASMIRYNFSGRQEVGSQVFVYHCDFPMAELMYV